MVEAATACGGGCNRMWRRLQPHVAEAATAAMEAAAICKGGTRSSAWTLNVGETGDFGQAARPRPQPPYSPATAALQPPYSPPYSPRTAPVQPPCAAQWLVRVRGQATSPEGRGSALWHLD